MSNTNTNIGEPCPICHKDKCKVKLVCYQCKEKMWLCKEDTFQQICSGCFFYFCNDCSNIIHSRTNKRCKICSDNTTTVTLDNEGIVTKVDKPEWDNVHNRFCISFHSICPFCSHENTFGSEYDPTSTYTYKGGRGCHKCGKDYNLQFVKKG